MADKGRNVVNSVKKLTLATGKKGTADDSTFEEYIDKLEAYQKIAKEIMSRFDPTATSVGDLIENGKWTPISDERRQTGLMSICPTLSTLLSMDVDLKEDQSILDAKQKPLSARVRCCKDYQNEVLAMLQFVINHVTSGRDTYTYDISPYITRSDAGIEFTRKVRLETHEFTPDSSFLGSICWVGDVMVKAYTLATKMDENGEPLLKLRYVPQEALWGEGFKLSKLSKEEEAEQHASQLNVIKNIIKDCVSKVIDYAILEGERDGNPEVMGWNYSKPGEAGDIDMSLYFTYRVADFWLILFKCLGNEYYLFRDFEQILQTNNLSDKIPCSDKYWSVTRFPEMLNELGKELGVTDATDPEAENAQIIADLRDRYRYVSKETEKTEFLFELNDRKNITDTEGTFARLKMYLLQVAKRLWNKYGATMDDRFFFSDLTEVPEGFLGKGGNTDILFNTLFMQGIMISAALDIELKKEDEAEISRGKDSNKYKAFLDTMDSALQKVLDQYTAMKREGEQYKVDRYILRIDTDKGLNKDLVMKIRRANIMGHTLVPLLTKINNLLSEYIIQYPQKQMKNYLDMILENSVEDEVEAKWIWDYDGYSAVATFYYVDALIDFYGYYEKYEKKYLANTRTLNKIQKNQEESIKKLNEQISDLNEKIAALQSDNERLEEEKEAIRSQDSVASSIRKIIREEFEGLFFEQFDNLNKFFTEEDIQYKPGEKNEIRKNYEKLGSTIMNLMLMSVSDATFRQEMISSMSIGNDNGRESKVYKRMAERVKTNIRKISKE